MDLPTLPEEPSAVSSAVPTSVLWSIAGACAFALIAGSLLFSGTLRALAIRSALTVVDTLPPHDSEGRTNVLLLGVGDDWHTASDLTDTIMIASLDPHTRSIVFLSIPRDLELASEDGAALGRINEVYATDKNEFKRKGKFSETGASLMALESTAARISALTEVPIHGVIKVNFSGFEETIDAVGGIDIDVPEALVDYQYPLEEGVIGILKIEAGLQHMDGKTALQYARSRHTTSDFDRADRQQQILKALLSKVKSLDVLADPSAIRSLQLSLSRNFESTLSPRELVGLAGIASGTDENRVVRMNLNFEGGSDYSDASAGGFVYPGPHFASGAILLPVSLTDDPADWSQIQSFASLLFGHREAYLEHAHIILEPHGTKKIDLQRLKNELLRYGFDVSVEEPEDPFDTDIEDSHILTIWSGETVSVLSKLLDVPVRESNRTQTVGREVRLILDKKFTYKPFVTLFKE